jgi:glutamine amidotransferase
MSRLLSIVTNDRKLFPLTLEEAGSSIELTRGLEGGCWGLGYYEGLEILTKKRPVDGSHAFADLIYGLRTNRLITHVHESPEWGFSGETTQPFRYRNWMMGLSGTLGGSGLLRERTLARIPDFIQRNIKGDLPPELVLHLFLARLHEEAPLDPMRAHPDASRTALERTLAELPELAEGAGPIEFACVFSNGNEVFGAAHRRPLYYRVLRGKDLQATWVRETTQRMFNERVDVGHLWSLFIASEPLDDTHQWDRVPDEHILLCDAAFDLRLLPIRI